MKQTEWEAQKRMKEEALAEVKRLRERVATLESLLEEGE